jgi:histidine triad (HIT) family protein
MTVSKAIQHAFPCKRVGLMVAGLEVPHTHLHLVPIERIADLDFGLQDSQAKPADLDAAAQRIRDSLAELGLDARAQATR